MSFSQSLKDSRTLAAVQMSWAFDGLRISKALGLRWRNILWDRGLIAIRETFVHFKMQPGANIKLSQSRVEAPQLLFAAIAAWMGGYANPAVKNFHRGRRGPHVDRIIRLGQRLSRLAHGSSGATLSRAWCDLGRCSDWVTAV